MGGASRSIYKALMTCMMIMPFLSRLLIFKTYKMLDCWHHPGTWNGILWSKESHTLLLKCFMVFPTCIEMIEGASDSIYKSLMAYMVPFLPKLSLKLHTKCQILDTLSAGGCVILWHKGRHPLLVKCFVTFYRCIMKKDGAFNSIYGPLVVHTVPFLPRMILKLRTKCQIWSTLSAYGMGYCTLNGDIHC